MKKNKPMRMASGLLAATLLTTSIVGGTFAKYITTDAAKDTARVAKFGVVASATGNLFGPSYKKNSSSNDGLTGTIQTWASSSESVSASDAKTTLVVAPGTNNDKGMTFTVKGKPEVSTKLTIDSQEGVGVDIEDKDYANTDIFLKGGSYSVMVKMARANVEITEDNVTDFYKLSGQTFTVLAASDLDDASVTYVYRKVSMGTTSSDYYPISWTVTPTINGSAGTAVSAANVAAVNTEVLKALTGETSGNTATKVPNAEWNNSATVTWKWAFSDATGNSTDPGAWADVASTTDAVLPNWENTTQTDLNDTVLGDMMALALDSANTDFVMAVESGSNLTKVNYHEINAATNSANKVWVAHTTDAEPSATTDASVVACLTASYGARITVEQVD